MEKKTWLKVICTAIFISAVATGIYLQWRPVADDSSPLGGWGTGNLKASEKAYYRSKISQIIGNWQGTLGDAERDKKGRVKESYTTYLLIDTTKEAIWIEQNGQVQQDNHVEFPAGMKWNVYRSAPEGSTELPEKVRLKIRGIYSNLWLPEQFYLVGTGRGIGHIDFNFSTPSRGGGYGSGRFVLPPYKSASKKTGQTEDSYGSLIVTDAEYQKYRDSLPPSDPNELDGQNAKTQDQSALDANKANWLKVEKLLYGRIEKEVVKAGLEIRNVKVEPGPDYSAAHAEVGARSSGVLRGMFGGFYHGDIYLKIDHLENDIWYANTAPDPKYPARVMSRRNQLDLEFLLCARGDIPDSQRTELLEKGRKIQQLFTSAELSKWKVTLPNGATAEFIGICEHPSAGRQWWGPDGSPIEHAPYSNAETYVGPPEDRKMFEIAWRIKLPESLGGGTRQTGLEGARGSYHGQLRDRYGNRIIDGLNAGAYTFDKSRKKTTLNVGIKVGEGDYQRVKFENISLVPGQDPGFKIELQN